MSRALGFHRCGGLVTYALVERSAGSPPEVLAAGHVPLGEVAQLYRRLGAERALPWALAEEHRGERARRPRPDWPLTKPSPHGMLHPATAAALWEWEQGRLGDQDLFLWLRPERLLWSSGPPGAGQIGVVPRRGPLREAIAALLHESTGAGRPAAVGVDGDAPGWAVMEAELRRGGCVPRQLRSPGDERGADRAAAGAALGALEPGRAGVFPAARSRQPPEPWLWSTSVLAAAAVGSAVWLGTGPPARPAAPVGPASGSASRTPATPQELGRFLARRRALTRAMEALLPPAAAGSVEELDLISGPGSGRVQVRLRLLPGGVAPSGLGPEFRLQRSTLADGSQLLRGEVSGERRAEAIAEGGS